MESYIPSVEVQISCLRSLVHVDAHTCVLRHRFTRSTMFACVFSYVYVYMCFVSMYDLHMCHMCMAFVRHSQLWTGTAAQSVQPGKAARDQRCPTALTFMVYVWLCFWICAHALVPCIHESSKEDLRSFVFYFLCVCVCVCVWACAHVWPKKVVLLA